MKRNIELYKMTSTAFLMAVAIILSKVPFLSTYISIGGYNLVKIGFQEIPLMLVCLIDGPLYSMVASLGSDLISAVFFPTGGVFFPGFTFDALLLGLIPSAFIKFFNSKKKRQVLIFICLNILMTIFSMIFIFQVDNIRIGTLSFQLYLWIKILLILFILIVPYIYFIVFYFFKFKLKGKQTIKNYEIFITIYIRDIVLSPLLAPIWIMFLYDIPFQISFFSQILSKLILIPIITIITIAIYMPVSIVAKPLIEDNYSQENKTYTKLVGGKVVA